MRKQKSISEFSSERNIFLLEKFRESLARQSVISARKAFEYSVESPAPRFWVSEERATEVISKMLKGEDVTEGMYPEKREMYLEIYRRVRRLIPAHRELPLCRLVFRVVNERAPRSYLSWERARRLIRLKKQRS